MKKTKPKKKEEFRLGEIRSWKEGVNRGSMEDGDLGVENTWFKGKVYSRRSKKTQIIDIVKGKEVMGEITLEDTDIAECLGDEDHRLESCQFTEDSSSANSESDNEALLCKEANSEEDREKSEENGFEGFRCLMESQLEEWK